MFKPVNEAFEAREGASARSPGVVDIYSHSLRVLGCRVHVYHVLVFGVVGLG